MTLLVTRHAPSAALRSTRSAPGGYAGGGKGADQTKFFDGYCKKEGCGRYGHKEADCWYKDWDPKDIPPPRSQGGKGTLPGSEGVLPNQNFASGM